MGNEQSVSEEPTQTEKIPETHENGSVNGLSAGVLAPASEISVTVEPTVEKNGGPLLLSLAVEPNGIGQVTDGGDGEHEGEHRGEHEEEHVDAAVVNEAIEKVVEEVKKSKEEKVSRFGKLFKMKPHVKNVPKEESPGESPAGASTPEEEPQQDTTHLIPEAQPPPEPDSASVEPSPEEEGAPETDDGNTQPEQIQEEDDPEKNSVMNFFKTLVTPTKTAKKSSAAPDAAKDQSENENQPAETATVAQVSEPPAAPKGMSVPPPPPPEPPKMETKGETSAKPAKTTPKEEPVKEPEASKGKSAKEAFGKFFRSKKDKELPQPEAVVEVQPVVEVQETPVVEAEAVVEIQPTVEEEPQPVAEEEKVDPSKTGTLEAAPKPEPPPPAQEKKPASKSGFMSIFKSKAADPKKASPAPPAAAEPAPAVKTKEEPKPAAKPSETPADNKAAVTAAQAGEDAPSGPKKLEKRNSIQLFFKIRSQKRNSTDAGIQTEPLAGSAAAEKSK
ncbi:breast carcinoma-amplified sequence 1 isoform X1 [Takifugu rubripes]|uniref:breast carcinoma-amplified sequence 1 isoform X1 n=1 Tax=Takifugu rubripes TaxID=31033 RepID=UPI0011456BB5|nr:pollen-specific leucine-rich repeat extensin-like protein 1 isoform X1 [Takifugu rubripes]